MLWNPLGSSWGRMVAFFFLYMAEGLPWGFTAVAIADQLRRTGMAPDEVALYIVLLRAPHVWKWAAGPFIDCLFSVRLGRRRAWIVASQTLLFASLLFASGFDLTGTMGLWAVALVVTNACSALQDVAIDALACETLPPDERGQANGYMWAGSFVGMAIGGSLMLMLADHISFRTTFFIIAALGAAITVFVSTQLREDPNSIARDAARGFREVARQLALYPLEALKAMFGTRAAIAALVFALVPTGATVMSSALLNSMAVDYGMSSQSYGTLTLISSFVTAAACVIGGVLSDRFGRRVTISLYVLALCIPAIVLALCAREAGWILPVEDVGAEGRPLAPTWLVRMLWITSMFQGGFAGLVAGSRIAIFMDVANLKVVATQFPLYMAVLNLTTSYATWIQGELAVDLGYPKTLLIDAVAGLLCIIPLCFVKSRPGP